MHSPNSCLVTPWLDFMRSSKIDSKSWGAPHGFNQKSDGCTFDIKNKDVYTLRNISNQNVFLDPNAILKTLAVRPLYAHIWHFRSKPRFIQYFKISLSKFVQEHLFIDIIISDLKITPRKLTKILLFTKSNPTDFSLGEKWLVIMSSSEIN